MKKASECKVPFSSFQSDVTLSVRLIQIILNIDVF